MLGNSSSPNCTLSSPPLLGEICKLFVMVLLIVAIILGNVVSLLVFLQARQFRTSQGYLKVSLALADLAVGLIVVPYSVYREASSLASGMGQESSNCSIPSLPCFITGPIFAGCTFVSITTIFLLSVERSVAVLKPLHKRVVITKRRTVWLILLSWFMSFLLAVVPMISSPDITLQYNPCSKMCTYTFPAGNLPGSPWNIMLLFPVFDLSLLGGTFVINFITFAAIHQYCKARGQLGSEAQHGSRPSFSDITAAKTIGIVTFAFSASFGPIAVFVVGSVLGYQWCEFSFYAFWILTSNSCWNVAIYSAWDPKFRQGVRELFSRPVLNSASQRPSRSTEGDSSAPACVAVFKEIFRPENA
ncbi:histamine H2 receptor-like [Malaclemys terrapin pileata]|uniref:histamine H2 receptor-like n=1 Tax=Malaclemys terrapin pileata TaxID=2991368 RepID=UPI0023A9041E|nr:histamine H2 receptor-like [Malaclemys terrapin pileata]